MQKIRSLPQSRLSAPLTPLVGREQDIDVLDAVAGLVDKSLLRQRPASVNCSLI